jgi:hypothetical protein
MQDVARHARRLWIGARIVSLVLPGGGHILGGRLISGAILVGGWSMVWLCVILWGRLLVMPGWVAPAGLAWAMVPLAAGGLLIWLWANLATLKRRRD